VSRHVQHKFPAYISVILQNSCSLQCIVPTMTVSHELIACILVKWIVHSKCSAFILILSQCNVIDMAYIRYECINVRCCVVPLATAVHWMWCERTLGIRVEAKAAVMLLIDYYTHTDKSTSQQFGKSTHHRIQINACQLH